MADAAPTPLISGNWKMHLNHFEALQTVQKLGYLLPKEATEDVDVSIHPPFTDIRTVQTRIDADKLPFLLGAQHCHWEDKGAFTGEVSPAFLAKLDVKYVICGHSERRELFGETDEMVADKATAILRHGMTPIICVGETLERARGGRRPRPRSSARSRPRSTGRTAATVAGLVIAYEPIWAIGTGRTATADDAQAVCAAIRATGRRAVRRGDGGGRAHPVRRLGEGVQHRRADGAAGHRRGPRRRGQPRPRRVRPDRPVPLSGCRHRGWAIGTPRNVRARAMPPRTRQFHDDAPTQGIVWRDPGSREDPGACRCRPRVAWRARPPRVAGRSWHVREHI